MSKQKAFKKELCVKDVYKRQGKDSMQIEFKSPDGTPESGEMNYFIYKLIAKKDYWAGIPQYKEFENNTLANS